MVIDIDCSLADVEKIRRLGFESLKLNLLVNIQRSSKINPKVASCRHGGVGARKERSLLVSLHHVKNQAPACKQQKPQQASREFSHGTQDAHKCKEHLNATSLCGLMVKIHA